MRRLIKTTQHIVQQNDQLPFSVYTSFKEQHIFNVPVIKPLLIFVLSGCKKLGLKKQITCQNGSFVFLSNSPKVNMRNITDGEAYFAILIEFDFEDFDCFEQHSIKTEKYFQGPIDTVLEKTLLQFVEWSSFSPPDIWALRRREILQLLFLQGYEQVTSIMESPTLSHRLHSIFTANLTNDISAGALSSMLAMSESTLRRKLRAEGNSLQEIKDRARLSHGLHLVQTSLDPIGRIAEHCGYLSQSRFTRRFKQLFGITPTELRKTRLLDSR
ncbi:MAG: AraC family transcriptional regulator [Pseudomonadota bacterium]